MIVTRAGRALADVARITLPLVILGVLASACDSDDRPNILVLFTDDQRADTVGAWGNSSIATPNLDRLARRGFSFRGNYCFGSNSGAVCVPSRAMLLTGRTWFDVPLDLSGQRLLPERLRQAGYRTFAVGKWHNGPKSLLRAFPDARSVFLGGMADHTTVPIADVVEGELSNKRTASKFSSEEFADAATEFLRRDHGRQPFFCYVAFTAPHDPRNPPAEFRERYYRQPPALPPNFLPHHPFDNGFAKNVRDENLAAYPRTEAIIRDQLCEYYGAITHLDEQIGRILRVLDEQRLTERTLVIFASDHGLALGSHGLLGKQSVYEHSMRSPLIVAGPGVPPDRETTAFTYLFDIPVTILTAAGVPLDSELAGFDLSPLWRGEKPALRDSIFLPFTNQMRSIRDERWKWIVYPRIAHQQLFDLSADPHEVTDLADRPEHRPVIERLRKRMVAWQSQVGDQLPLEVPVPATKAIRYDDFLRKPDVWQPDWIIRKYFEPTP